MCLVGILVKAYEFYHHFEQRIGRFYEAPVMKFSYSAPSYWTLSSWNALTGQPQLTNGIQWFANQVSSSLDSVKRLWEWNRPALYSAYSVSKNAPTLEETLASMMIDRTRLLLWKLHRINPRVHHILDETVSLVDQHTASCEWYHNAVQQMKFDQFSHSKRVTKNGEKWMTNRMFVHLRNDTWLLVITVSTTSS